MNDRGYIIVRNGDFGSVLRPLEGLLLIGLHGFTPELTKKFIVSHSVASIIGKQSRLSRTQTFVTSDVSHAAVCVLDTHGLNLYNFNNLDWTGG